MFIIKIMDSSDEFLIGGDELFNNPRFINHYKYMLEDYIPPIDKPIALFLSCSKHKPYYKSPYRRVFNAMIEKKIGIKDLSQIYTISEPAILVPEELDDTSVTKYDFPPEKLQSKGKEIFIERLVEILPKILKSHKISFYILPKHHKVIFEDAFNL
jgi:predicted RNA-binding protein